MVSTTMTSILVGFLQRKPYKNDNDAFEKWIIYIFFVVIFIHSEAIIVGEKYKTRPVRLLCGKLAPILLLLILFPAFGWMLLVIWVFLAVKTARDYFHQLYCNLLYQASGLVPYFFAIFMTPSSTPLHGSQDPSV